jgi:hypothetical protein
MRGIGRWLAERRESLKIRRLARRIEPGFRGGIGVSGGGTVGRPDMTACPGCHGSINHFTGCRYDSIPLRRINGLRGSAEAVRKHLDKMLNA